MSTDSIGFPTPRIVNGYACLTGEEMALAKKNIDPARPHEGTGGPQDLAASGRVPFNAQRLDAVRQVIASSESRAATYAPNAPRAAVVAAGTVYATQA
jgi:hypothetical protein